MTLIWSPISLPRPPLSHQLLRRPRCSSQAPDIRSQDPETPIPMVKILIRQILLHPKSGLFTFWIPFESRLQHQMFLAQPT